MNRWLALAIAIPLGGAIAWFATMALFVAVAAFAWLYVFGDSPWPEWFDLVTRPLIFISVFGGWALATWRIWRALMAPRLTLWLDKRRRGDRLNRNSNEGDHHGDRSRGNRPGETDPLFQCRGDAALADRSAGGRAGGDRLHLP